MKNTRIVDTKLRLQVLEILNELKIDPKTGVEIFEAILAGKKFNINKNEATASKIFKQQALSLQSKIAEKEINIEEAGNSIITFADPTFDSTFKILFGTNDNKDILISLLNSLLDFKDENKIKSLEITTDKILGNIFSYTPQKQSLHGAVDILCTTENNKKIAIEMQRAKKSYSLARTQEYMSKLISMQLKTSDSNEHDKKLLDTYILTIDKDNLFTGEKHSLVNQHVCTGNTIDTNLYEIEVEPIIKQTGQVFPGNKMHWKFFELSKFKLHQDSKEINKNSDLKLQWLEFFNECSKQLEEPDRNELIKKGYGIMKTVLLEEDKQVLYWKEQRNELDALENQKIEIKKCRLEERITSDIDKIKMGIKFKVEPENLITEFKCLNKKRFLEKSWSEEQLSKKVKYDHPEAGKDARKEFLKFLDIFNYVKDHQSEKSDAICSDLKLLGDLEVIGYSSDAEEYN